MDPTIAYSINTPRDNRHQYDSDWRHRVSKAMVDTGSVCRELEDDDVYAQTAYLRFSRSPEMADVFSDLAMDGHSDSLLMQVHAANAIYGTQGISVTKDRIEALLLCPELTYQDIARAFNVEPTTIQRYERLFFNVRDHEGKMLPSKGLLDFFALKGMPRLTETRDYAAHWRVVAFESGHAALLNLWGWPEGGIVPTFTDYEATRHLLRLAFSRVEEAFRTGQGLDSRTFGSIFESINAKFSEYREKGMLSGTDQMTEEHLILHVLELMAPELAAPSDESKDAKRQVLGDRLSSLKSSSGVDESGSNKSFEFIEVQNIEES